MLADLFQLIAASGVEATLEIGASWPALLLSMLRSVVGNRGAGNHDAVDPLPSLLSNRTIRRPVAGGQHHVVLGDDLQALAVALVTLPSSVTFRKLPRCRARPAGDAHPVAASTRRAARAMV
jgi:hypothetical protein